MKRGRLNKEEQEQILELFALDLSVDDIASELDRSVNSVNNFLEKQAADLEDDSEEVVETKLNPRPNLGAPVTKTAGGKDGVAVATNVSSEKMSSLSEKTKSDRGKLAEVGGYPIYAE